MKKSDLWIPCSWENRRPTLLDGFFYVPDHYFKHKESGYSFFKKTKIFNNDNPVNIEYCSGNGQWIIDRAQKEKDKNWIAVEFRFDRARKIWLKMKKQNISNLFVVFGEGLTFTKNYIEDNVIEESFVNFPDPWPKKKHAKNRIVTCDFLNEISRITTHNGNITLVTDDEDSSERFIEEVFKTSCWKPVFENPYYINDFPEYGSSYFNDLWKDKGKTIRFMNFKNIKK